MGFNYPVKSVLARLGSPNSDIIKFSFQTSVDAIQGKDAYKLLLALSLFAKDASREALGYVAGFGEDEDKGEGLGADGIGDEEGEGDGDGEGAGCAGI